MPTFADRGCCVVSTTDPYSRILGFLEINYDRSIKWFLNLETREFKALVLPSWLWCLVNWIITQNQFNKTHSNNCNRVDSWVQTEEWLILRQFNGTQMQVLYGVKQKDEWTGGNMQGGSPTMTRLTKQVGAVATFLALIHETLNLNLRWDIGYYEWDNFFNFLSL
jgi:hypothetical protein